MLLMVTLTLLVAAGQRTDPQAQANTGAAAGPILAIQTQKGTIEIQLFPSEAPKSVGHIVDLVKRNFYRAQRFHRAEASLVQFGDPGTRDMSRMDSWGTGNSGNPIGVFEQTRRKHVRGAVGLAHGGNARGADSQIYIMKTASPSLDGKHVVIGQVIGNGMAVVDKIVKADRLLSVTLK
jgi:cyclophilin family peptidyl-prolyl cis-trans isomerase